MQRYLWPGYEVQLLRGLQEQQNSAQFCDTLLQTEGISVPTHSCILAALSPYLSQKISASPPPPPGQKRQLQLQAVKAQTLLKLVGLLYSGFLEVKGNKEKSDVLAAAHQFGITDLVQGQRDGGRRESPGNFRERQGILKIQDEAEMSGKGEKPSSVRKKSYKSVGTQTVTVTENSVDGPAFLSGQTEPPNLEPASSVAQSLDVYIAVPHQNITPSPTIPSDGESSFGQSSDNVTNFTSTSALSTDTAPFPTFLNDSSPSEMQEDCNQDSSESGDSIQWWAKGLEDVKTKSTRSENERNAEQPRQVCRDKINRKDDATQKNHSHGNAGVKDLTKMKEMLETAQISIKVKLRRTTTGELWEVVNIQGPDETSVVTSLTQDCTCKRPQTDEVQLPPSPAHPCPVQKPEIQRLPPAVTNSFKQPEHHSNTTSDSQSFSSSSSFTSNCNSAPESVSLPQPQDESDEQIEKLLEDIMMGLNILPNLESDSKKSEPSHSGAPIVCRVPVMREAGHTQMDAVAGAAECVFYQDLGTKNDHTSTDTGVHRCFAVPDQPSCTSFPSVQPDGLIQQQEPQSPQYFSPGTSLGQNDGLSCQGLPLFKSQNSLYPEAPTSSVPPSAFFAGGQKLSYSACQSPSSQDDQHSLKVLPLSNGNGTQPEPAFSFPCMDDLRLPPHLSPLEPNTSATKSQPLLNNSTNPDHDVQQQPSLRRRPWLSENSGSLPWFPFSSIIFTDEKSARLPANPDRSCRLNERQEEKDSNPKKGGTSADSLKDRGIRSAAELKSYPRRMKETFRYKHDDATGSGRKRRHTNHRQDATGSCSAHKNVKISDGTKSCSVSLSNNNVLVKEREMAMMSSNMRHRLVGKPREMSTVIESEQEQPKESRGIKRTRIRTRGFVKKSQEAASSTTPSEKSRIFKTGVFSAQLVNQQGVSLQKRKRGRPRKIKLEEGSSESVPAIVENKGDDVNREQVHRDSPMEEEADEKNGKRCRKRRRNKSEVEVIPLKKIVSADYAGKAEEATNSERKPGPPKHRHMVTLKEFQKLINCQHSKGMKPKENQETHGDAESKARTNILGKKVGIEERTNTEGSNIAVDQNHNNLFNTSAAQCCKSHQDERSSCLSEKPSVDADEDPPVSFDVVDKNAASVTTEREQPPKSLDEGMTGELDAAESPIKHEGSSHSLTKTTLDCKLLPRTLETTGPPLSNADGISRTSGCDKKEKEEDEEEVDVLVYSPEKAPQTRGYGDGLLSNIDMTPDEDEEEDVNEIDVTGDEAE